MPAELRWTDLRLGTACNQACRFCDQAGLVGDPDTAAAIAALTALPHRDGVVLAGGELSTRADLPTLVRAARELGFRRVALQTNGAVLAAPGAAAALRAAGLAAVALAVHGPNAEVHDPLAGAPGSFRRAAAAARHSVAAGLELRLQAVLTRTTTPLAPALVDLAHALRARSLRVTLCREEGRAAADARRLAPRWTLAAEALIPAAERARLRGVELEIHGLPPCLAPALRPLLADRRDVPQPERVYAAGAPEPRPRVWPEPCAACALRPMCPGVEAAYVRRWGADELQPAGPRPAPPEVAELRLEPGEGSRVARQRLVAWQARGVRAVRLVEPLPDLAGLVRDAERLGLQVHRA